jgi:hypothetical protein
MAGKQNNNVSNQLPNRSFLIRLDERIILIKIF